MAVYLLDDNLWFPYPYEGEADGLIAVGGDLSADRLLLAYSHGIFPWYSFRYSDEPHWYCPLDRFVIIPNEIHVSHSMRQLIRQQKYQTTINQDFHGVIRGCSIADGRKDEEGAWLGNDMIKAYTRLHELGYAVSVEVWENDGENNRKLVGGLYGVAIGKSFFGESMFSLVPNASKLALIHLAQTMSAHDGILIDCQFETPHLLSMGGKHISYDEYLHLISIKGTRGLSPVLS